MARVLNRSFTFGLALLAPLLLVLSTGPESTAIGDESSNGASRKVFLSQKCNMCHPVSSAGIEATSKSKKMHGSDLTGIAARREPEWIAKFLRREVELDGQRHKKKFGGSDEELKILVAWLEEQKK